MEQDILSKAEAWAAIRESKAVAGAKIPLPLSNSIAAKQMRLAIGLAVLAKALQRYIFQPLYISKERDALTELMDGVAEDWPDLDAHARGVILNVCPETQNENGQARAEASAMAVFNVLASVISQDERGTFEADLRSLCSLALSRWLPLQRMTERVKVEAEYTEPDEWKTFPMPKLTRSLTLSRRNDTGSKQSNIPDRTSNGSSQADSRHGGMAVSGPQNNAQKSPRPEKLSLEDVACEIWPAFIADDDDLTALHLGYVLTKEQVKEAREQAEQQEAARRADRQKSRRRRDSSVNRPGRRRSDSKAFLSSGNGDNSAGV